MYTVRCLCRKSQVLAYRKFTITPYSKEQIRIWVTASCGTKVKESNLPKKYHLSLRRNCRKSNFASTPPQGTTTTSTSRSQWGQVEASCCARDRSLKALTPGFKLFSNFGSQTYGKQKVTNPLSIVNFIEQWQTCTMTSSYRHGYRPRGLLLFISPPGTYIALVDHACSRQFQP